jgi:cytidyltransferase-like protein|tara:strand:+ start:1979 stop:2809 length:831 start_codon:yes stop_codon:yes gene_type:complete
MKQIVASGSFDNIMSQDVRFLEEAAKFGPLHVFLWSDETVNVMTGAEPKFPMKERRYILEAVRYVHKVVQLDAVSSDEELLRVEEFEPRMWVVDKDSHTPQKYALCASKGIRYSVIDDADLTRFPCVPYDPGPTSPNQKVVVTGCFDWFHSGHVRFFEETSELGDLYVIVGHDDNVRLLKGDHHPLIHEHDRCYMAGSIRFVKLALVSSGSGWMDAAPEIEMLQPAIYAVNEDGDHPQKSDYCKLHGIDYIVLKRAPADGLPHRESTQLRRAAAKP